jgi:hypothetical protein
MKTAYIVFQDVDEINENMVAWASFARVANCLFLCALVLKTLFFFNPKSAISVPQFGRRIPIRLHRRTP